MVLTEGWDMPEVGCCVLARPTKKMGLYRQMIGRVLRPAEGKTDAIILDHSGAVFRHGFAEDHVDWTLDPDRRAESATHQAAPQHDPSRALLECSQCGAMRVGGEPCCALRVPAAAATRRAVRGRRRRARPRPAADAPRRTTTIPPTRQQWHGMLASIARRARLQARLGRAQVPRKIRQLSALGLRPQ